MKKLISLMLALIFVFSMATVAMADTEPTGPYNGKLDQSTSFTKAYLVNNGTAPAEHFGFSIEFIGYKDNEGKAATTLPTTYPTVTLGEASFGAKTASAAAYTSDASVGITNYEQCALGVYTYKITENAGTTAGVNYVATPVYLNVTVLVHDGSDDHYVAAIHYTDAMTGNKVGSTQNSYDAGTLNVRKLVTGNMGDTSKDFTFTVKFEAVSGRSIKSAITYSVAGGTTQTVGTSNEVTITLKHDQTATFTNVPYDVTYTVTETQDTNYETTYQVNGATAVSGLVATDAMDTATENVVFTNNRETEVDTGITLDSLPFVLILAVCAGAVVLFVIKRRNSVEF